MVQTAIYDLNLNETESSIDIDLKEWQKIVTMSEVPEERFYEFQEQIKDIEINTHISSISNNVKNIVFVETNNNGEKTYEMLIN